MFRCEGKIQSIFQILCTLYRTDALFRRAGGVVSEAAGIHATIVKIVVDTLLFLVSFRIQKGMGI